MDPPTRIQPDLCRARLSLTAVHHPFLPSYIAHAHAYAHSHAYAHAHSHAHTLHAQHNPEEVRHHRAEALERLAGEFATMWESEEQVRACVCAPFAASMMDVLLVESCTPVPVSVHGEIAGGLFTLHFMN